MVSRRHVLVGGGSGLAALGLGRSADPACAAPRADDPPVSLFLYERSIEGVAAAADALGRAGVPLAAFGRDVGAPWLEIIEPMWRLQPRPIAGLTRGGALFCLEQLARGHALACTFSISVSRPEALEAAAGSVLRAARMGPPARRRTTSRREPAHTPIAWLLQPIAGKPSKGR